MSYETYKTLIFIWMGIAGLIFLLLLKVTAPYGRHASKRWGPQVSNNMGWVIMEAPGMILLLFYVLTHISAQNAMSWTLVGLYIFHYINRTFIFPFRIRTKAKKMPLAVMLMAVVFNLANGFFLGYYFAHFADYSIADFMGAQFIAGLILFALGMYINWDYDNRLIHLRKPGETGYKIPHGGLFKYISCPNLMGEVIEWTGYAIMSWNLPALSFLVWTIANLVPRALSHHKWYRRNFENYPDKRKAVIPFVI
jgi:3-oxo-5-alpha-steroid 4-dehydrogenase 1